MAVLLTLLCFCILLMFVTFWPRGTWYKMQRPRIMMGSFTDKEMEEFFNRPPEYIWIREEDGLIVPDNESFGDRLKRWFSGSVRKLK
jgi:hypothetical protein